MAFSDYAKFRDAMNATGQRVWFSLCGWESWYSPPDPSLNYTGGASLGNSWRIAGDGSGWGPLTNCMNTQAGAANFTGPGGWADPDLLIGPKVYVGGQTDAQARAQFTMWALFPANLLISQNMLAWSDYALETYSNAELISINQDPLGSAAQRVAGGDLKFPCSGPPSPGALASVAAADCDASDAGQRWAFDAASGHITSAAFPGVLTARGCGSSDGNPVEVAAAGADGCGGRAQAWAWGADGRVTNGNSGSCLDVFDWAGPTVDTWACNGGSNQQFKLNADGTITEPNSKPGGSGGPLCLRASAGPPAGVCTNVWGRKLTGGAFALGLVNNGGANAVRGGSAQPLPLPFCARSHLTPFPCLYPHKIAQTVTCDAACFAATGVTSGKYTVRDLWAHADVGTVQPPYSFAASVPGGGFASAFKLTPA